MNKKNLALCSLLLIFLFVVFSFYGEQSSSTPNSTEFALVFNQAMAEEKANPRPKITPSDEDQTVIDQLKAAETKEDEQRILQGASQFVKRLFVYTNAGMDYFDFYGRVIDQFGEPVEGVQILAYIGGGHLGGGSGGARAITDSEGYFKFADKKGGSLQIREMMKPGYELEFKKQGRAFMLTVDPNDTRARDLDDYQSRKNAYVYQAWKVMSEDRMASTHNDQGRFGLVGDDRVYSFDLLKPEKQVKKEGETEGQIRVRFWRSTNEKIVYQNDWKFTVEAINGGILETSDLYMKRAPESGYQAQWVISKEDFANQFGKHNSFIRHFYLHDNNRLYARLSIKFWPYNRRGKYQGTVKINYSINTRGEPYVSAFKGF